MTLFRILLIIIGTSLTLYTLPVILNHGPNLFPQFFGDIAQMGWPGQFNLDFLFMLLLSGLWVSWRHEFTLFAIGLGLLAFFGGALFLSIYLFTISFQAQGDMKIILLGKRSLSA